MLLQLEGTYKDHLVQLPDQFRADQELNHIVKRIVQIPLKDSQACSISRVSRKCVPVFSCPLGNGMFPNVKSESPLEQL